MKKKNNLFKRYFSYFPLIALVSFVGTLLITIALFEHNQTITTLTFSDVIHQLEQKHIAELSIAGTEGTGRLHDGSYFVVSLPERFEEQIRPYIIDQKELSVRYKNAHDQFWNWTSILLFIGVGAAIAAFVLYRRLTGQKDSSSSSSGGIFGMTKSRSRVYMPTEITTRLDDVAGAQSAKEALADIIDYLKNPKKYQAIGAQVPRGILLIGEPGNGKTMLARALAGEAKCPFILSNGSDFIEVFVGVGASRVRDLFSQAKRLAPCIVFIDEIDAVGRQRGAGIGGGNDEREQTLNQLLTEMDGFDLQESPIIVIAATNRPEILDRALLRHGRFDRRVVVPFPDNTAREQILRLNSKRLTLANDVDFFVLAQKTAGFSGADLAHVINQAALLAAREKKTAITMDLLLQALKEVLQARASEQLETNRTTSPFLPAQVKSGFDDVAGLKEAKQELEEIVDILINPERYEEIGAQIPRGVLLTGDPGNGKTLLARAVAGQSNRPFFYASGSSFIEEYVGVGAQRVRELFSQARKHAPSVVFIDEIDAIGGHRSGDGGGGREYAQTLNQLLTEMDGFSQAPAPVVVLAATNRADILDSALVRPGRFDRTIHIPYPDIRARKQILDLHAKKIRLDETVQLDHIAQSTSGFSGASLAALMNEAALLAARAHKQTVGVVEIDEARDRIILGLENRGLKSTPEELERTAYHEAGHTLTAILLHEFTDPIYKVTIIPRGSALGVAHQIPAVDIYSHSKEQLKAQISICLGSMAAENITYGNCHTGVTSDLQQATRIARAMICDYGMSDRIGPRAVGFEQRNGYASNSLLQEIDAEISDILKVQYTSVFDLLNQNKAKLTALAQALLQRETLHAHEVYEILQMPVPKSITQRLYKENSTEQSVIENSSDDNEESR